MACLDVGTGALAALYAIQKVLDVLGLTLIAARAPGPISLLDPPPLVVDHERSLVSQKGHAEKAAVRRMVGPDPVFADKARMREFPRGDLCVGRFLIVVEKELAPSRS